MTAQITFPSYIVPPDPEQPRGLITAEEWNNLWNLIITQGNLTTQEVEVLEELLSSVTDGSSGADSIGATAISGLTGATVQALLEALQASKVTKTGDETISGNKTFSDSVAVGNSVTVANGKVTANSFDGLTFNASQGIKENGIPLVSTYQKITNLPNAVRHMVLEGLSTITKTVITASDSVISAFGKLQAQITDHKDNLANPHSVTKSQVGLGNADNTSDLNKPVSTAQATALSQKVDKVTGKGLSTEDYTTTEKTKLAGIATGANNYTHPATHSADMVVDGTTNKVYTATEKTKLAGIAANVSVDLAAHTSDNIAHIPRVVASGTVNAYTATIPGVTAYTDDLMFWVTTPAGNTGAATINVNGLGAKEIYTPGASSLASGTLLATQNFLMHYRSNWEGFALLSRSANDVDTRANQYILNKTFNSSNILSLDEKTTPIDADGITLIDCVDRNKIKRLPWSNLKSTIKAYFDTLYAAIIHTHNADAITDGTTNKVYTSTEKNKLAGIAAGANNYSLPIASTSILGGVKVGDNLTMDVDGTLNAMGGDMEKTIYDPNNKNADVFNRANHTGSIPFNGTAQEYAAQISFSTLYSDTNDTLHLFTSYQSSESDNKVCELRLNPNYANNKDSILLTTGIFHNGESYLTDYHLYGEHNPQATATTQAAGDNSTKIATTAFVQNIVGNIETLLAAI